MYSQALDRSKPLWETWLVQGLEGGRFALISKNHHALVDGIAGVDLMTVLFDLAPVPAPVPPRGRAVDAAARRPARSTWPRAGCAASPRRRSVAAAARAAGAARRPAEALEATREALEGARRGRAGGPERGARRRR